MKNKKAIFVCGSGGSGKTTFVNKNFPEYAKINVDLIYEDLLIKNGLGLKILLFSDDEMKKAYELFEDAKRMNNSLFLEVAKSGNNMVIDGIGRDPEILLDQREYLSRLGYDTYLIMLYADLDLCIKRVEQRERIYKKNITVDSWYLSYSNIPLYKKEFNDNFLLICTDKEHQLRKLDEIKCSNRNKKRIL